MSSPAQHARPARPPGRPYSRIVLLVLAVVLGWGVPIVTSTVIAHQTIRDSNHQWCALVEAIDSGTSRPTTAEGRKIITALQQRGRSLAPSPAEQLRTGPPLRSP